MEAFACLLVTVYVVQGGQEIDVTKVRTYALSPTSDTKCSNIST